MSDTLDSADAFVLIYDAHTQTEAELVCAALQAAGVQAVLQNQYRGPAAGWLNYLGNDYGRGVLVPAADLEVATAILSAQDASEDEILAALELDTVTTDEAEALVK